MSSEYKSSEDYWRKLGSSGLLCQEQDEGGSAGVLHNWNLCSELLPWGLDVPGVVAHNDAVASYLYKCSRRVQDAYFKELKEGARIATVAITEPSSGSNTKSLASTIHQINNSTWILNAEKEWITNAPVADLVFVLAVHVDGEFEGKTSVVVVDMRQSNITASSPYLTTCLKSSLVGSLSIKNLKIDTDDFVGKPGSGAMQMMFAMARERTSVAAVALATSRVILDFTVSWVKTREVSGGLLAGKQSISHRLSILEAKLALAESSLSSMLLESKDARVPIGQATRLKLINTELQNEIASSCSHLFGAESFREGSFIARQTENARVQKIYAGTSEIMTEMIANELGLVAESNSPTEIRGGVYV
ncbi:acyl-CoA dehydrogenase family protein [Corynebacterium ulcerans]|uniref:acyl-CoA dehydrogenase family protein n=1 Tax=Corynebacterium ulcerans TaxID=65058 RepID=UPI0015E0B1F6|nr:acyl-CoA dehydrogenase family protein [Corynebacterium ulcerans]MBH5297130.1 acyl-CoA dehydrogenase family protein [Corynebacterium ulcerans]